MHATGAMDRLPLELPLLSCVFSPESTHANGQAVQDRMGRGGRRLTIPGAAVIGSWPLGAGGCGHRV